jgi:hypothetical protein
MALGGALFAIGGIWLAAIPYVKEALWNQRLALLEEAISSARKVPGGEEVLGMLISNARNHGRPHPRRIWWIVGGGALSVLGAILSGFTLDFGTP